MAQPELRLICWKWSPMWLQGDSTFKTWWKAVLGMLPSGGVCTVSSHRTVLLRWHREPGTLPGKNFSGAFSILTVTDVE